MRALMTTTTGRGGGASRSNTSSQPAGFLASSRRARLSPTCDRRVTAGDLGGPGHGRQGPGGLDAEAAGRGHGHGRVGLVGPARQVEVSAESVDRRPGRWSARGTRRAMIRRGRRASSRTPRWTRPAPGGAAGRTRRPTRRRSKTMRTAAARAPGGVGRPRLAGAHPGHVGGRAGSPGHQRIVGVGHHGDRRVGHEDGPPAGGQAADLVVAVELVAAQVEQQDDVGRGGVDHPAQPGLVDFEHGPSAGAGPGQGGGQAGREVGAEDVGDDRARRRPGRPAATTVVVVLPLVPLTSATDRPAASRRRAPGSRARMARPPITDPPPRPSRRDSSPTAPPTLAATRVRVGSASGTVDIGINGGDGIGRRAGAHGQLHPPRLPEGSLGASQKGEPATSASSGSARPTSPLGASTRRRNSRSEYHGRSVSRAAGRCP